MLFIAASALVLLVLFIAWNIIRDDADDRADALILSPPSKEFCARAKQQVKAVGASSMKGA